MPVSNTLPFRLLAKLVDRSNAYLSYEELYEDVWESHRSDSAVRSVVKRLRFMLRDAGMSELAAAIDGSISGRYSLRLSE